MNDPERDPHPSVEDHQAEQALALAEERGVAAGYWMTCAYLSDAVVALAVVHAREAASWYHEAQRLAGECPEYGASMRLK